MKRLRLFVLRGATLAVLGLLAGCGAASKSTAPTPVDQSTADDFAVQAVASLGGVSVDFNGSVGGASASPSRSDRVAPFAAEWDTTYTTDKGLNVAVSRTFYDGADNALPGWSPAAVRLHRTSRVWGTISSESDTATIGHQGSFDVRGIQSEQDTLTFDGTALDTLMSHMHSLDGTKWRYFFWQHSLDVAGVRILKSTRDSGGKPFAGTITMIVSADLLGSGERGSIEKHYNATIVVVFHDGSPADVTVNSTFRYHWDPVTGTIGRA